MSRRAILLFVLWLVAVLFVALVDWGVRREPRSRFQERTGSAVRERTLRQVGPQPQRQALEPGVALPKLWGARLL